MEKETNIKTDFELAIESIAEKSNNSFSITDLENTVNDILSTLPNIDRDSMRREMEKMIVPIHQAPTTFDINKGLALSQTYRDRLTEMHTKASREYKIRKRCIEMLFDAVSLTSKASSADKRRGESTMRYPILLLQLEASEIFLKEVEQMLINIKSSADSISRQGSIIQSQIQLNEYTRRRTPDEIKDKYNEAEEKPDYHSNAPKINVDWEDV